VLREGEDVLSSKKESVMVKGERREGERLKPDEVMRVRGG